MASSLLALASIVDGFSSRILLGEAILPNTQPLLCLMRFPCPFFDDRSRKM